MGENAHIGLLAGYGDKGFIDGPASKARFDCPTGLAVDNEGNVYVADQRNHRIRKITPGEKRSDRQVTTVAGFGQSGLAEGDEPIDVAKFLNPTDVALDHQGRIIVVDQGGLGLRRIDLEGQRVQFLLDLQMFTPILVGVAIGPNGDIFVTDPPNSRIFTIREDGSHPTFWGADSSHKADLGNPTGIAADDRGNLYITDRSGYRILKMRSGEGVDVLAGNGQWGHLDGEAKEATFRDPVGVTVDEQGVVYVADSHRIRRIQDGRVISLARRPDPNSLIGATRGLCWRCLEQDKGEPARLLKLQGIAVDKQGTLYVTTVKYPFF